MVVDRTVALDRVVAELAEDHVVRGAARDVVAAEAVVVRRFAREVVVEVADHVLRPVGDVPAERIAVDMVGVVDLGAGRVAERVHRAGDAFEARVGDGGGREGADRRVAAEELDGVAEDQVVHRAAVDPVAVGAADEDVLAVVAVDRVGAADRHVGRVGVDPAGVDDRRERAKGVNHVAAAAEAELGGELLACTDVLHDAGVAEDDVVALSPVDLVVAEAADDHERERRGLREHLVVVLDRRQRVRDRVAGRRAAGGLEDEEAVARGTQVDGDGVAAEAGVEDRRRPLAGAVLRPVDRDGVVTRARPVGDAVEQVARGGRRVRDARQACARDIDVVAREELRHRAGVVGVGDRVAVRMARGLVAHEQAMAAVAEIDVQGAAEVVEVAGEEVELLPVAAVEIGVRRQVHPVVAVVQLHARHCCAGEVVRAPGRALHVEDVGAVAGLDLEILDAVVLDAVHPRRQRCGAGERARVDRDRVEACAQGLAPQRSLEVQHVDVLREVAARVAVDRHVELVDEVRAEERIVRLAGGDCVLDDLAELLCARVVRDRIGLERDAAHVERQPVTAARRVDREDLDLVDLGRRVAHVAARMDGRCACTDADAAAELLGALLEGCGRDELLDRRVAQRPLEADRVDVVVARDDDVAGAEGGQRLERGLDDGGVGVPGEAAGRLVVEHGARGRERAGCAAADVVECERGAAGVDEEDGVHRLARAAVDAIARRLRDARPREVDGATAGRDCGREVRGERLAGRRQRRDLVVVRAGREPAAGGLRGAQARRHDREGVRKRVRPGGGVDHELLDLVRARQAEPGQRGRGQQRRAVGGARRVDDVQVVDLARAVAEQRRVGAEERDRGSGSRAREVDPVRPAGLLDDHVAGADQAQALELALDRGGVVCEADARRLDDADGRGRAGADRRAGVEVARGGEAGGDELVLAARRRAAVDPVARRARHRIPRKVDAAVRGHRRVGLGRRQRLAECGDGGDDVVVVARGERACRKPVLVRGHVQRLRRVRDRVAAAGPVDREDLDRVDRVDGGALRRRAVRVVDDVRLRAVAADGEHAGEIGEALRVVVHVDRVGAGAEVHERVA